MIKLSETELLMMGSNGDNVHTKIFVSYLITFVRIEILLSNSWRPSDLRNLENVKDILRSGLSKSATNQAFGLDPAQLGH